MSNDRTDAMGGAEDGSGWSPERMMARLGGDEVLTHQLVALFLTECPRMMADVRASVAQGSADVVRRAAHAFKGSVSNFTDRGAVVTALELERMGREDCLADAPATLARLEQDVALLMSRLLDYEAGK